MRTTDTLAPGQKLLVRLDLNTSVEDGQPVENHRFRRHSETLEQLLDDHAVAVMTHQGRPGRNDFISTRKHAEILQDLIDTSVQHIDDIHGETAVARIRDLSQGDCLLLENTRMSDSELPERPADEHAQSEMVRHLTPEFDAFVNDAYPAAHRSHASMVGFTQTLPSYAGPVMESEHRSIEEVKHRAEEGQKAVALLGGDKPLDVFEVMRNLESVDRFLVAGVPAQAMLHHREGLNADLSHQALEEAARTLNSVGDRTLLPVDLARELGSQREETEVRDAKSSEFRDIGRKTIDAFRKEMRGSDSVLVKGSPGVFEDRHFEEGTRKLLRSIKRLDCFTLVGGGTTGRAVKTLGIGRDGFNHVSISGGAYLRALTAEKLPAIEALEP